MKINSDIECSSNSSYTRKYQDHVPCSFAYKVVCVDNKFSKKFILYRKLFCHINGKYRSVNTLEL